MRKFLLTVTMILASGSAMASSIETIHGKRAGNGSIISITCETCPPVKVRPHAESAPALPPGTQDISVRDVDGKKQVVRRESWLGGSPVTYISNNPAWMPVEDSGTVLAEKTAAIDTLVKTSAVENGIGKDAAVPVAAGLPTPLAFDGLVLRQSQ